MPLFCSGYYSRGYGAAILGATLCTCVLWLFSFAGNLSKDQNPLTGNHHPLEAARRSFLMVKKITKLETPTFIKKSFGSLLGSKFQLFGLPTEAPETSRKEVPEKFQHQIGPFIPEKDPDTKGLGPNQSGRDSDGRNGILMGEFSPSIPSHVNKARNENSQASKNPRENPDGIVSGTIAPRIAGFGTGRFDALVLTLLAPPSSIGGPAIISINAGSASDPGPVQFKNGNQTSPSFTWFAKGGVELPSNYETLGLDKLQASRFLSHRYSEEMAYDFSLRAGSYRVQLSFAEMYVPNCDEKKRVFAIYVNNEAVFANVDVFKMAKGCELGLVLSTRVQVSEGSLMEVRFQKREGDKAFVSAIDIFELDSTEEALSNLEVPDETEEPSPEETADPEE